MHYLSTRFSRKPKLTVNVIFKAVLDVVEDETNVPRNRFAFKLIGRTPKERAATWALWWSAREAGLTLKRIAMRTGFDHTSVMHGIREFQHRDRHKWMRDRLSARIPSILGKAALETACARKLEPQSDPTIPYLP